MKTAIMKCICQQRHHGHNEYQQSPQSEPVSRCMTCETGAIGMITRPTLALLCFLAPLVARAGTLDVTVT